MAQGSALLIVLWVIALLSFMVMTTLMIVRQDVETAWSRESVQRARQLAEMGIAVAAHPGVKPSDPLLRARVSEQESYETLVTTEESRLHVNSLLTEERRAVLERVRDAIDRNDLPAALAYALSNRETKLEIDEFNKAVAQRFGERTLLTNAAREPSGKLFDKLSEGMQPQEKERLKEAWPVMRAAQQLAAHERTTETLRQAEELRLAQRQAPVMKQ